MGKNKTANSFGAWWQGSMEERQANLREERVPNAKIEYHLGTLRRFADRWGLTDTAQAKKAIRTGRELYLLDREFEDAINKGKSDDAIDKIAKRYRRKEAEWLAYGIDLPVYELPDIDIT